MAVNRTKVLEAAQKFLSKGQYDKAIAEYQKLVAEDPRDVRTLLKIGDLHTRRNKPKDAIDIYDKVAELYAKQGFFLKAVAVYKQILKLDPSHLESTLRLAKMYEELALASDALSTYEQAADAFLAHGQTDKALETMQRMIALDGQNVAARIKYAEALSKANKQREAALAFAEGARLLREQGRIDDYIRVVERQLYHDPDNVEIARELSGRYLERNDPKRALAKLQVCFKADPRDVQTLEMLAEAFRQLGQVPKTISVLKEIARLHAEVNAEEPRRRTLLRVLDLDPTDAEARAALGGPSTSKAQPTRQAEPPRSAAASVASARVAAPVEPPRPVAEPPRKPPVEVVAQDEDEYEAELSIEDAEEGSDALLMVAEDPAGEETEEPSFDQPEEPEPTVPGLLAEAEGYESNGDYDRAELALRNALLLDEDHVETHERLKDVYLAADRRVEAVRELLWLSEAVESHNPSQAQSYARTAFDLAPHAEATRRRLEALGLLGKAAPSAPPAEEVVFVEDSHENLESEAEPPFPEHPAPTERERPSARAAAFAQATPEPVNLLDLPISPDDFDAAVPDAPRSRMHRDDVVSLLDQPISAEEFDAAAAQRLSPAPEAAPHEDMAALLDAPISPDEFDAPPPRRDALTQPPPAYDLLDEPVDDFGLSDDRFDRSDLHEVSPEPVPEVRRRAAALEIVEEDESIDELSSEDLDMSPAQGAITAHPNAPGPQIVPSLDDFGSRQSALPTRTEPAAGDSDWGADAPEPTVPGEPIPELIRRSSQESLEPVVRGTDTVRPKAQTEVRKPAVSFEPPKPAAPSAFQPAKPAAPSAFEPPKPVAALEPPKVAAPMPAGPSAPFKPARAPEPLAPPKRDETAAAEVLTPEIEEALGEAEFFASQGLLDEALELVQEALLIYPRSASLQARLREYEARAEEMQARAGSKEDEPTFDESFDIAEQLASELSEVPAASAQDEMIDVESVFAQFKKGVAAQISEDDTDTHFDLGIAYKEMGLIEDAIGEFELSARSPKRACIALTMVGMCHIEKGDALKAVSYFERALGQPVKAPAEELALNYEIGQAYELTGQLEKALSAFERVAVRDRTFRGVSGRIDQLKRRGVSASASGATG